MAYILNQVIYLGHQGKITENKNILKLVVVVLVLVLVF
jgi:hypothetical protein